MESLKSVNPAAKKQSIAIAMDSVSACTDASLTNSAPNWHVSFNFN